MLKPCNKMFMAYNEAAFWLRRAQHHFELNDAHAAYVALHHAMQNLGDCNRCGGSFQISKMEISEAGQILCEKCRLASFRIKLEAQIFKEICESGS